MTLLVEYVREHLEEFDRKKILIVVPRKWGKTSTIEWLSEYSPDTKTFDDVHADSLIGIDKGIAFLTPPDNSEWKRCFIDMGFEIIGFNSITGIFEKIH